MPHKADIRNGAGIDLNPGFAKAFGVQAPFMLAGVTWDWAGPTAGSRVTAPGGRGPIRCHLRRGCGTATVAGASCAGAPCEVGTSTGMTLGTL